MIIFKSIIYIYIINLHEITQFKANIPPLKKPLVVKLEILYGGISYEK